MLHVCYLLDNVTFLKYLWYNLNYPIFLSVPMRNLKPGLPYQEEVAVARAHVCLLPQVREVYGQEAPADLHRQEVQGATGLVQEVHALHREEVDRPSHEEGPQGDRLACSRDRRLVASGMYCRN